LQSSPRAFSSISIFAGRIAGEEVRIDGAPNQIRLEFDGDVIQAQPPEPGPLWWVLDRASPLRTVRISLPFVTSK
jgi:hypothetical protein